MLPETETELEEELGFEKDDDLKNQESRIFELRRKKDRTPEEEEEFSDLKKKHRGKLTAQIEEEKLRARREAERAERAERELEELRDKQNKPEKKQPVGNAETIQINGKEFYTDRGLVQMVNSGAMTQDEAYAHQEERREEKAVARLRQERQAETDAQIREEVKNKVLKEHPEFNPKHPDHDPNDPLFKEANEIWMAGLYNNPRGLEIALEKAKRILGRDYKRPDLTEELGVTRNQEPATRITEKSKKVILSEAEQELAWTNYRTQINPKTRKTYTQAEAIEKARLAKEARLNQRRV